MFSRFRCIITAGCRSKIPICIQPAAYFGQPAYVTHPHLLQDGEVTPGINRAEFHDRRKRLMKALQAREQGERYRHHIVIVPSATKLFMSHDIPYPFRQNSDFLYLCGFMEPDSLLILEAGEDLPDGDYKSTLFVPRRDDKREQWDGTRTGVDGAVALTGVDSAYNTNDLGNYLSHYLRDHGASVVWYDYGKPNHAEFHNRYISDFLKENKHGSVEVLRKWVHTLRTIKSSSEIALMEKSCEIGAQAVREVMKFSHPKVNEAHLQAKMDYECRLRGAEYLAYPPVIAGGTRANTIHYISNNQLVEEGDMVLMDAGCEYHGYTSDITRTWPVSGRFSDVQREVYEAVLEVNEECLALCHEEITLEIIFSEMLSLIGKQLQRLRILEPGLKGTELQWAAREFCPHHVGHYLGMDVHDTDQMSRNLWLQPGMVITIEPGLYFRESNPKIPPELRGIGVRIEDDVLIQNSSYKVLTRFAPKRLSAIETLLGNWT